MLEHGGNLHDAIQRYGRPRTEWLDLSTGINPHAYPVPPLAADAWHRLPEPSNALLEAAQAYYGAPQLLPVAGTQAAIQALPRLRAHSRVVIAAPSYAEHSYQWRQAGHEVREVGYDRLAAEVDHCDVLSICNPNNPTGEKISPLLLLEWAARLAVRGGWLIVDEAFGDTMPEQSVAAYTAQKGLIVFRSVGKFFGLAGVRLGFVAAHADLLQQLADVLGPWTVSGPAQQIGAVALSDTAWQQQMRRQLRDSGARLRNSLQAQGIQSNGTELFQYWPTSDAAAFAAHMAQHGIWSRIFSHGVRLGLPPDDAGWQCLQQALADAPHK